VIDGHPLTPDGFLPPAVEAEFHWNAREASRLAVADDCEISVGLVEEMIAAGRSAAFMMRRLDDLAGSIDVLELARMTLRRRLALEGDDDPRA